MSTDNKSTSGSGGGNGTTLVIDEKALKLLTLGHTTPKYAAMKKELIAKINVKIGNDRNAATALSAHDFGDDGTGGGDSWDFVNYINTQRKPISALLRDELSDTDLGVVFPHARAHHLGPNLRECRTQRMCVEC